MPSLQWVRFRAGGPGRAGGLCSPEGHATENLWSLSAWAASAFRRHYASLAQSMVVRTNVGRVGQMG